MVFKTQRIQKRDNDFGKNALRFRIESGEDLIERWKDNNGDVDKFLEFKVLAKNNFSGLSRITIEKFHHPTCVYEGEFEHGDSVKISKLQ